MNTSFELKPLSPSLQDLVNGEALIDQIRRSANRRRVNRPALVAWSFRCEKELHSKLQRAADRLDPLAMSDIVNGLLEVFLPIILSQRATTGEQILAQPDKREQLANLLASLTEILKEPARE